MPAAAAGFFVQDQVDVSVRRNVDRADLAAGDLQLQVDARYRRGGVDMNLETGRFPGEYRRRPLRSISPYKVLKLCRMAMKNARQQEAQQIGKVIV
jgi:hypothetical protein